MRRLAALTALIALAATIGGCMPGTPGGQSRVPPVPSSGSPQASADATSLTIYSGRSEELAGPILERFTEATGIQVDVRYGDTAELASLVLEEGAQSPADVFFAQDAGALGAVAEAGLFSELDPDVLSRVDEGYRDPEGRWVGVSGRARVAAYSLERLEEADLPASIMDFTDPSWKGRLGWAPTNGSLQAFVTALRILEGEDAARAWLEGIQANEPKVYESNTPAVQAIAAGEIDVAFVNHYYLLGQIAEQGDDFPVGNHFFEPGDPGALVNVAGVGILATSDEPEAAAQLVDYLLSTDAQTYFAEETYEYPLIEGVPADERLKPLAELGSPPLQLNDLSDLQGTIDLLREVGVLD